VSAQDVLSLNRVQATPWSINTYVLDVQRAALAAERALPGIPLEAPIAPPGSQSYEAWRDAAKSGIRHKTYSDEAWAAMDDASKLAHRVEMARTFEHNARVTASRHMFLDLTSVADELRSESSIYFPHNRCFRGRIYPAITSGPHPQTGDMGKSLLHFAEGKALGALGYYWLLVRAANCAGKDKMTLNERVGWTLDHKEQIKDSARAPEDCLWWSEINGGDEAWSLLATCHELSMAWASGSPETFVSHLPVPMDGTCNGLQHLSALSLDPVGAVATNLADLAERQDIYLEVGAVVRQRVISDAQDGDSEALKWAPKMSDTGFVRGLVKRAVMTTPYGVTASGIRDQILNDRDIMADVQEGRGSAAEYIKVRIMAALEDTAGAAQGVMGYLREVATDLAKAGIPFRWTTPTGSTIEQAYRDVVQTRVPTLCGQIALYNEPDNMPLAVRKQAAGAPPNYIHSLDGAHLSSTVNAAHDSGVRSFAMIHDSFGTHAADTQTLAGCLRKTFVDMYSEDILRGTAEEIRSYAPHVSVAEPPERRGFDIRRVLKSEFFFS